MILAPLLIGLLAGAPLADLSPYAVRELPDGSLEFSYDLTAVKALAATPDAVAVHGEPAVKAFLKSLPRSAKVVVEPDVPLELAGGRGVEGGRLALSFAGVADGPMASDNPLGRKGATRLRPPLDPDEPHVLLSAEAVAWQLRQMELGALAAEEVDTEALRRELWSRVLERALRRHQTIEGDAREGALALTARVAAALACLDGSRVSAAVRADSDSTLAVDAELARLRQLPDLSAPPAPWSWRPELSCAWVSARVMAQPFERTRAGTGAVLIFLDILQREPHLREVWERIRSRRDRFQGAPDKEPLLVWKAQAKDKPSEALESLNDFLESLPIEERQPPALVSAPLTPFLRFWSELSGAERGQAFGELASAAQDHRVNPGLETWPSAREATLVPFCAVEDDARFRFDGEWRDRLQSAFTTLLGGPGTSGRGGTAPEREDGERSELKVRLLVPPHLDAEPLRELYVRSARSLELLVQALEAEKLKGLAALQPDGQRGGPIVASAKVWIGKLKGLAALGTRDLKTGAEGRRLATTWRSEPGLTRDVREASAAPVSIPSERQHSAIVGVSRRELAVTYAREPKLTLVGGAAESFALQPSEQRYIVPVLVSVGSVAEPGHRAIDRNALKALIDEVGRDPEQVEGAFADALKGP